MRFFIGFMFLITSIFLVYILLDAQKESLTITSQDIVAIKHAHSTDEPPRNTFMLTLNEQASAKLKAFSQEHRSKDLKVFYDELLIDEKFVFRDAIASGRFVLHVPTHIDPNEAHTVHIRISE